MSLYKIAKKFKFKLGFYRSLQKENKTPEFRLGELVIDRDVFENLKQFSFFIVEEYNENENGLLYECQPKNKSIQRNENFISRFPEDFFWFEQERKNEFFDVDSLLKITSMKHIINLYKSL